MTTLRIASLFALLASMASAQFRQTLGFPVMNAASGAQPINAAATWLAYGWMPPAACTVTAVKVRASAVAGTIGSSDLSLEIYSTTAGNPGTSQATTSTVTATPTGPAWVEFTGLSFAMTALTQYWFVLKNNNGTPGTNSVTYKYLTPGFAPNTTSGTFTGPSAKLSTNSGSTWAAAQVSTPLYRIQCADGSYYGYPYTSPPIAPAVNSELIFSGQQYGAQFTTPANAGINVSTANFFLSKSGSPTGSLQVAVYSASATVCTSDTSLAPASVDASTRWIGFAFSTPCALSANTMYRVVLAETAQSDTSSNNYTAFVVPVENDANSLPLAPFNGTLRGTYCASACSATATWTTVYDLPTFGLQLTSGNEFTSAGGSGGQKGYAWVQ